MGAMQSLIQIVLIGVIATLVVDIWATSAKRLFGMTPPNWPLVGRWIGHFRRGRFRHENIAAAVPVAGEASIGWAAHYAIGIAFAALLIIIAGTEWLREPKLLPALSIGIATVAAPFFIMQPGMGLGIAASRTPNPWQARARSLVSHAMFGLGLYIGGLAVAGLV